MDVEFAIIDDLCCFAPTTLRALRQCVIAVVVVDGVLELVRLPCASLRAV